MLVWPEFLEIYAHRVQISPHTCKALARLAGDLVGKIYREFTAIRRGSLGQWFYSHCQRSHEIYRWSVRFAEVWPDLKMRRKAVRISGVIFKHFVSIVEVCERCRRSAGFVAASEGLRRFDNIFRGRARFARGVERFEEGLRYFLGSCRIRGIFAGLSDTVRDLQRVHWGFAELP